MFTILFIISSVSLLQNPQNLQSDNNTSAGSTVSTTKQLPVKSKNSRISSSENTFFHKKSIKNKKNPTKSEKINNKIVQNNKNPTKSEKTGKKLTLKKLTTKIRKNYIGLGLDFNYGIIPNSFMKLFLQRSHSLTYYFSSFAFIWQYKHTRIHLKGLLWQLANSEQNWLAKNHNWEDAYFVELKNIGFYGVEIYLETFVNIYKNFNFVLGAGLGGGVFSGNIKLYQTQGCNSQNWQTTDTNPSWGGCYHAPNDYTAINEDFPPGLPILETKAGFSYSFYKNFEITTHIGLFFPGLINFSFNLTYLF